MNLNKAFLLRLAALFAALPLTLARYQASLICEHGGGVNTESSSEILYACYTTGLCTETFSYTPASFPEWDDHFLMELYGVDCDFGGQASICYNVGGTWLQSDTCPDGHEAVITIVNDTQRRRRLGEPEPEQEEFEKQVDIGGEPWTIIGVHAP